MQMHSRAALWQIRVHWTRRAGEMQAKLVQNRFDERRHNSHRGLLSIILDHSSSAGRAAGGHISIQVFERVGDTHLLRDICPLRSWVRISSPSSSFPATETLRLYVLLMFLTYYIPILLFTDSCWTNCLKRIYRQIFAKFSGLGKVTDEGSPVKGRQTASPRVALYCHLLGSITALMSKQTIRMTPACRRMPSPPCPRLPPPSRRSSPPFSQNQFILLGE